MTLDARLTRRQIVGAGLAGGTALALGPWPAAARRRPPLARGGSFAQGIASGLPNLHEITLWTRLDGIERTARLELEVARDPGFRHVVHRRAVSAAHSHDFTVNARIDTRRLKPAEHYWYRFATQDEHSPVGRFKTRVPHDSQQPIRIGVFSCQERNAGYYTAHQGLAAEDDLDLVLCLGDYIYERNYYDGPAARRDTLGKNHDGEVETLPEYREKYRLYKSDPDLQALHTQHPIALIWDDHEVEDNYAGTHPGAATKDVRVPFLERRANAYRAFFEFHPIPRTRSGHAEPDRTYRSLRFGRNADLFLLDTRQYRDDQPCNDQIGQPCPADDAPGRTLMGATQKAWLKAGLKGSDTAWRLIANQVMIMGLDLVPGVALNHDQWDGYGAERKELLGYVREQGIRDVSFLTGDIHTFFAGDVHVDGTIRTPKVASEFVGGSVTSDGIASALGLPESASTVTQQIQLLNPHIVYNEQVHKGYMVVEASERQLDVVFKGPATIKQPRSPVSVLKRFRVQRGDPTVRTV